MKIISFFSILLGLGNIAFAQQEAQYSQYMFNLLAVNPAYAGYKETLNVSILNRNQWTGQPGAPKTQSVVADAALGKTKKVGLGLLFLNDKIGLQSQTSAFLNYAYRLPVGANEERLSFGLAFGLSQYFLNGKDAVVDDISDEQLTNNLTYFTPSARFGIHYSSDEFYAGFSIVNLLGRYINYQGTVNGTVSRLGSHYFFNAGYLLDVNESIKFKPSLLIKEDYRSPTSIDVNFSFLFNEKIWLGASYRSNISLWKKKGIEYRNFKLSSLVGMMELYAAKNLRIGYAYDYNLSSTIGSAVQGSHEISIGYIFNSKSGSALQSPRFF